MLLPNKFPFPEIFRNRENRSWTRYFSPQGFYPLTTAPIPWLGAAALIFCTAGLVLGLFVAPVDQRQGEVARIVFVHVPASLVSILIYLAAAAAAVTGLVRNARLATMTALALAPTGLMLAFLGVWTGSLWSKSTWGTWWAGDLHTYSEFALALLYVGFIGLHAAIESPHNANKAGAWLLLAGVLTIPFNLVAAPSWTSGHLIAPHGIAGAGPSVGELASLLAMSLGFLLYAVAAVLLRLRCVILERERQSDWVTRHGSSMP